jgi:hypothetical protein
MVLDDHDEIVKLLGGVTKVARLFGIDHAAVSRWVSSRAFPPQTYPVIRDACARFGFGVDEKLWSWAEAARDPSDLHEPRKT